MSKLSLLLFVALAAPLFAGDKPDPFIQIKDTPGLPRVLILGDSISIGYTLQVRELLKGKANVHRPATNCSSTREGVEQINEWLGKGKWDVVHFNFGLHDLKYVDDKGKVVNADKGHINVSLNQYESNLRAIIQRLKATGAKLIFATTTPVPEGTGNRVHNSEEQYNAVALKVIGELNVELDDLHEIAKAKPTIQLPHNVHFNPEGCQVLAVQVAAEIEKALAKK